RIRCTQNVPLERFLAYIVAQRGGRGSQMSGKLKDWRASEVRALEVLIGKPYAGNENRWQRFLSEQGLAMEYLGGVRQAIDSGKWRWKGNPIAWVRKASKCVSIARFGLQGETYER